MNYFDIPVEQNYPVNKRFFDFMQLTWQSQIKMLTAMYGNNLILYGVELAGNQRTAGAVVINGELLPFAASPDNAKILIEQTVENALYKTGELRPSFYTRTAKCSATGTINLADLKRVVINIPSPTDWQNCTPASNITVTQTLQARVNERGKVELRGEYMRISAGGYFDFTLPAACKPAKNRMGMIVTTGTGYGYMPLYVTNDGKARCDAVFSNVNVVLDNCEFEL
ncbi:hypothetical protein D0T49_00415 [Paludibacter sp. 221]|uniref:hypothetical protein n=1 Tax=Paludibacter sp. 221 TaxID=2302939 RepID=UPI0013D5C23F|nr:hypothetical protein [Paludibacter sp. 221]NDV45516.1 hypothetical protein [Paludibacter sp. 221]